MKPLSLLSMKNNVITQYCNNKAHNACFNLSSSGVQINIIDAKYPIRFAELSFNLPKRQGYVSSAAF